MIQAALIVPTWHYFSNPFKLQPLNELYLATALERDCRGSAELSVVDLRETRRKELGPVSAENVASIIPEKDLYLHWVGKTADFPEVAHVVALLREAYPKARHVAGGMHIEVFPAEGREVFDAVVFGPGETSFAAAIRDLDEGKGLEPEYRSDWKQVNYCDFPFPRRSFLPEDAVVNEVLFEQYGGVRGTSAMFSRGCSFSCGYCVYNLPHHIQMRGAQQIMEEILYLKREYRVEGVNLRDEICVPLAPKTAVPYLEAIGSTSVIWRGQTKVGAPREVLELARQTGCVELALGVESASQQVLDIVNKKQNLDQVRQCMETCQSLGIRIKMCLIMGLPGEPHDILERTIALIEETRPDFVNVSGFCPAPGSPIFREREKYGIKWIDENWSRHAHLMFRFSDEEHFGLPFEYHEETPWGKSLSNARIAENIRTIQTYLRNKGMAY